MIAAGSACSTRVTVTASVLVTPATLWVAVAVNAPGARPGNVTVNVPSAATVAGWFA